MNIPLLYVVLVTITIIAMGRGLVEAVFGGSKKRLRWAAIIGFAMIGSWTILDLMSGKQVPEGLLAGVALISGFVATTIAIVSAMAMACVIFADRESLPGKG